MGLVLIKERRIFSELHGVNLVGSFSKPRRRRRRERHQTKGLMSKIMVLHVRFQSWYISLPFSVKQQRVDAVGASSDRALRTEQI